MREKTDFFTAGFTACRDTNACSDTDACSGTETGACKTGEEIVSYALIPGKISTAPVLRGPFIF